MSKIKLVKYGSTEFPPLPPKPKGGWKCVLIDFPWSFSDKGSRLAPDWKDRFRYATVPTLDLHYWAVDALRAELAANCHVWSWFPDSFESQDLCLLDDLGATPKQIITWRKVGKTGKLRVGGGHYARHATEHLHFAVRGRLPVKLHNIPDVFDADRQTPHSRKPHKLYEIAEALSPGPRLECFATERWENWTGWGLSYPKS